MIYTMTITVTAEQDAVIQEIATTAGKTVQQLLDDRAQGMQTQINQWILDKAITTLKAMDPAVAYAKLTAE